MWKFYVKPGRLLTLLPVAFALSACASVVGQSEIGGLAAYYCPQSDKVLLEDPGNGRNRSILKIAGPAVRSLGVEMIAIDAPQLELDYSSCSGASFYCIHAKSRVGDSVRNLELVVPRTIRNKHEFSHRGVHGVTRATAIDTWNDRRAATVTLWQSSGGRDGPIELTFEEGRGLIYWDGIRLGSNEDGEMCVLEKGKGLLSEVKIAAFKGKQRP